MSLSLPPPIARYVQLKNAGETAELSACFAPNAMVRDEGRTYEGLAAITAWKAVTTRKYHTPPDFVVRGVTAQRKPPEVRICKLRNQSRVGTVPPSTSTPHWPACWARR